MRVFHHIPDVPVQSNVLIDSRSEALAIARSGIDLSICERCGFIANTAFDPSLVDYSAPYEEAQGFSARFRAYADDLAESLTERYALRGADVVEIGCGRGDFLEQLCATGTNRGVGIDPSYRPRQGQDPRRADYRTEYYAEAHTRLPADLIVCRHTLEHIADVRSFMELVALAASRSRAPVVLEVPDVERVLRENAFWDIYYEHSAYFTADSLRHLFGFVGFETLHEELVFDGQYLIIEARIPPAPVASAAMAPPDTLLADGFGAAQRKLIRSWAARLEERHSRGESVVLWGASSKAVGFLTQVPGAQRIDRVVDINPHKTGRFIPGSGQEIVSPGSLTSRPPDLVVVMNPVYEREIRDELAELSIAAEVISL